MDEYPMTYGRVATVVVTGFDAAVAQAGEQLMSVAVAYCRLRMQTSWYQSTGGAVVLGSGVDGAHDTCVPSMKLVVEEIAQERAVAVGNARVDASAAGEAARVATGASAEAAANAVAYTKKSISVLECIQ